MHYKKLEGKRIYLSPMNVEDTEKYVKWMNDRKVTDGIASTAKLINSISEKAWVEKIMENVVEEVTVDAVITQDGAINNVEEIEKALEEGKLPDNSTPDTPETVDTETENEPTVEETKPEEKDVQAVEKKKPAKKFKRRTTDQVFGHTWMGVIYDV